MHFSVTEPHCSFWNLKHITRIKTQHLGSLSDVGYNILHLVLKENVYLMHLFQQKCGAKLLERLPRCGSFDSCLSQQMKLYN